MWSAQWQPRLLFGLIPHALCSLHCHTNSAVAIAVALCLQHCRLAWPTWKGAHLDLFDSWSCLELVAAIPLIWWREQNIYKLSKPLYLFLLHSYFSSYQNKLKSMSHIYSYIQFYSQYIISWLSSFIDYYWALNSLLYTWGIIFAALNPLCFLLSH